MSIRRKQDETGGAGAGHDEKDIYSTELHHNAENRRRDISFFR